jgi:O-antigen/teichoic acid export membrane protein
VANYLFPDISKRSSKQGVDRIGSLTADGLTYASFLLIPGPFGGILIGNRLLWVYGPGFVRGTEVNGILLAEVSAYSYADQLLNTLNAVDRPDLTFRANAVFSATNVVLNVVLIAYFGWVGAAVTTAVGGNWVGNFVRTRGEDNPVQRSHRRYRTRVARCAVDGRRGAGRTEAR